MLAMWVLTTALLSVVVCDSIDYPVWTHPIVLTGTCDEVALDGSCSQINVWHVYKGKGQIPPSVMTTKIINGFEVKVIVSLDTTHLNRNVRRFGLHQTAVLYGSIQKDVFVLEPQVNNVFLNNLERVADLVRIQQSNPDLTVDELAVLPQKFDISFPVDTKMTKPATPKPEFTNNVNVVNPVVVDPVVHVDHVDHGDDVDHVDDQTDEITHVDHDSHVDHIDHTEHADTVDHSEHVDHDDHIDQVHHNVDGEHSDNADHMDHIDLVDHNDHVDDIHHEVHVDHVDEVGDLTEHTDHDDHVDQIIHNVGDDHVDDHADHTDHVEHGDHIDHVHHEVHQDHVVDVGHVDDVIDGDHVDHVDHDYHVDDVRIEHVDHEDHIDHVEHEVTEDHTDDPDHIDHIDHIIDVEDDIIFEPAVETHGASTAAPVVSKSMPEVTELPEVTEFPEVIVPPIAVPTDELPVETTTLEEKRTEIPVTTEQMDSVVPTSEEPCIWGSWRNWSACECECENCQGTRSRNMEGFGKNCENRELTESCDCKTEPIVVSTLATLEATPEATPGPGEPVVDDLEGSVDNEASGDESIDDSEFDREDEFNELSRSTRDRYRRGVEDDLAELLENEFAEQYISHTQ